MPQLARTTRLLAVVLAASLVVAPKNLRSQAPISSAAIRANLQRVSGPYPVLDIEWFGRDSARIVVEDSSRTTAAVTQHTWLFGPPVTAAEAAGCPPQKVLGRRIARALWRLQAKAVDVQQIIVRVHGRSGLDRLSFEDMYYGRSDLDDPWIGDRVSP
jgi:hypothetical protein